MRLKRVQLDLRTVLTAVWGVVAGTAGPVLFQDGVTGAEWWGVGALAVSLVALAISWVEPNDEPDVPNVQWLVASAVETSRFLEEDPFLDAVQALYPHRALFEFNGYRYPVTLIENRSLDPDSEVDSILGRLSAGPLEYTHSGYDSRFEGLHERIVAQCVGKKPGNLVGYALDRIEEPATHVKLHCKLGTFALAQATSFTLETELFEVLARQRSTSPDLAELPARDRVHRIAGDPVMSGAGRCAEVALSVVTVIESHRPEVLLLRRSEKVATDPFKLHVAPSGKFQRTGELAVEKDPQYSLLLTLFREFAEEVFGELEAEGDEAFAARTAWDVSAIAELQRRRAQGDIEIYRTGLAVSLTDLQPEVTALLIVREPRWLNSQLRPNWEYLSLDALPAVDGRRLRFQLDDALQLDSAESARLRPSEMLSRAAVAIGLGLDAYRRLRS